MKKSKSELQTRFTCIFASALRSKRRTLTALNLNYGHAASSARSVLDYPGSFSDPGVSGEHDFRNVQLILKGKKPMQRHISSTGRIARCLQRERFSDIQRFEIAITLWGPTASHYEDQSVDL